VNLGQLKTDVTTWLNAIAFDVLGQPLPVEFGRMPRTIITKPYIVVYLAAVVPIGHDQPKWRENAITGALEEVMLGIRRVTLRLQFIAFNQEWGQDGAQYAEQFRGLVQSTTSKNTIHNFLNVGNWGTGPLTNIDFEWSGRMVSRVEMDVTLGVVSEVMNTDYDGSYIKSVNVVGEQTIITEQSDTVVDEQGETVIGEDSIMDFTVTAD
jgi:hypothetical protein